MSDALIRHSLMSAIFVIFTGSLLHFAWELSGRHPLVAVFGATNESTWEHLKLAFWPALALVPVHRVVYGNRPGWLPAAAIRCVLPSLLIIVLFYGYTSILGSHYLTADLAVFAIAVTAGELLGHSLLATSFRLLYRGVSLTLLILSAIMFSAFTFWPPESFLFRPPTTLGPGGGE